MTRFRTMLGVALFTIGYAGVVTGLSQTPLTPLLPDKVLAAEKPVVSFFDTGDVRITGGRFKEAMETDRAYLLRLDPDRLLAWFRKDAGLEPKGEVYGGWESEGIAGHSLGHYLSACAQMYRCTGDAKLKQRVDYIVDQLAQCQLANGDGYVSAIPNGKKAFAEMARGDIRPKGGFTLNGCWVPWYTMHKIMAGLFDSATLCGNGQALDVLVKLTDWCGREVAQLSEAQMQKMLDVEQGGMTEVLANVYSVTGNDAYLQLSKRFRHDRIFVPLSQGHDVLDGWHANANIPKFIGYQRVFELTGEAEWGTAATNFWTFVSRDRSYANGGHGLYEFFFPVTQFEQAMHSTNGPETCNSYNMLKLTTHLFAEKPEASFVDFYEKVLFNHILASQHPQTGGFVYYTPMSPGSFRTYSTDTSDFWCCVGTGMENHARYGQMIYAHAADKLLVNLFIPSVLNWAEEGATVVQETAFPDQPATSFLIKLHESKQFTIAIRYPAWVAEGGLKISVNGADVAVNQHPQSYVAISRQWQNGDRVDVQLPMRIHTEMLPNSKAYTAIFYGPVLLAGELGREGLVDADFMGQMMSEKKAARASGVPVIVDALDTVANHLEPVQGKPLVFQSHNLLQPMDVMLAPLYEVYDQRCAVYWRLSSAQGWKADEAKWAAAEARESELATKTIDHVRPGEQQPEVDHRFKGENTFNGSFQDRNWRDARDGGWFSYLMKVDPAHDNELLCVYWGSDVGRSFKIMVDDQPIAIEKLDTKKANEFVEVAYAIPSALTNGKKRVTVKFLADAGSMAGGLFDCRTLPR